MTDMKYELSERKNAPGEWGVEAIGSDGEIYMAIFSGPEAEERARAYVEAAETIGRLEDALGFYRDRDNYDIAYEGWPVTAVSNDKGQRARAALPQRDKERDNG